MDLRKKDFLYDSESWGCPLQKPPGYIYGGMCHFFATKETKNYELDIEVYGSSASITV